MTSSQTSTPFPTAPSPEPTEQEYGLSSAVRRLAEIDDELRTRGILELTTERDKIRTELKEHMIATEQLECFDETSGYEARLQASTNTEYDVERLKGALMPAHFKLVVKETVDGKALADLIRMGVTTQTHLERCGVIGKTLRSVSLIVRPRKEQEEK